MKRHAASLVLLLLSLALTTACGGNKIDPILALSAEEALTEGKALFEQEKYFKARKYLSHAYEVEPNSALGREALLMVAESYYKQGGEANLIQAEAKYRDFLNRFPTSDRAAYVQLQIGNSLAQRTEKPDRDQSATSRALEAYEAVLRFYPTSEYAAQARERIQGVRDKLAEHEFVVARFYQRLRVPLGAISRYEGLLEEYPNYEKMDEVLFHLADLYRETDRPADVVRVLRSLKRQYPDSPYAQDLPDKLLDVSDDALEDLAEGADAGEGEGEGEADPAGEGEADAAAERAVGGPESRERQEVSP